MGRARATRRTIEKTYTVGPGNLTRWPKRTRTAYDRRVKCAKRPVALLALAGVALLSGGCSGTIWARDLEPEDVLEL